MGAANPQVPGKVPGSPTATSEELLRALLRSAGSPEPPFRPRQPETSTHSPPGSIAPLEATPRNFGAFEETARLSDAEAAHAKYLARYHALHHTALVPPDEERAPSGANALHETDAVWHTHHAPPSLSHASTSPAAAASPMEQA